MHPLGLSAPNIFILVLFTMCSLLNPIFFCSGLELDKLMRNFLGSASEAKVNWDSVCKPKSEGTRNGNTLLCPCWERILNLKIPMSALLP